MGSLKTSCAIAAMTGLFLSLNSFSSLHAGEEIIKHGGMSAREDFRRKGEDILPTLQMDNPNASQEDSLNVRMLASLQYDSTETRARGIALSDSLVYIADWNLGLRIISIADICNPVEVGSYFTGGHASNVAIIDSYAYVADGYGGLKVISVIDPTNPVLVDSLHASDACYVAVSGSYAYLSDYFWPGLRIISISDPGHPVEVGIYLTEGGPQGVAILKDYAYVAMDWGSAQGGILVLSVIDPSQPEYVTFLMLEDTPWEIETRYPYAFVADEYSGLAVLSIADPSDPVLVTYHDTSPKGYSLAIDLADNTAYIADWQGGLRVISVYDPYEPQETGYYITPGQAWDVVVRDSHAFIADGDAGLKILEYYGPTIIKNDEAISTSLPRTFSLDQNYPNPFNPTTTISFDIPGEAGEKRPVILTIYDLRGRHVNTLVDEAFDPGTHQVVWVGKNEQGQQVSSGVYLYTLKSGVETHTRKMVILE